jgi:23S rRNA (guanosine2251-2'-O)-methyltransferase
MANVYGLLPVIEALKTGRRVDRIIIADGARPARLHELLETARRAGVPVRREPRVALDRLARTTSHQGVIAIVGPAGYADATGLLTRLNSGSLIVLLDGIEDPHNLGAIIRTAECAGATAVVIPERRAAQLTDTVAKTSAGALEHIPVARVTNLVTFAGELKKLGVWIVGVERSGSIVYSDFDYSGSLALVFGAESRGLHRLVRESCDLLLSIPMRGRISSLNVSVAAGIVLFEAARRRQQNGSVTS